MMPKIKTFTEDELSQKYKAIMDNTNSNMDTSEIINYINKTLENGIILTEKISEGYGPLSLYRVTKGNFDNFDPCNKNCYSYPPSEFPDGSLCKKGRANIEGSPVLYTSIHPMTAVFEMKGEIKPGETFYISRWVISPKEKIIIHDLLFNTTTQIENNALNALVEDHRKRIESIASNVSPKPSKGLVSSVRRMGDLFVMEDCTKYYLTGAYSHFVLYEARKQGARIDAVKFPSVEHRQESINYAIHPDLVNSDSMHLKEVFEVFIAEGVEYGHEPGMLLSTVRKGVFNDNGEFLRWEGRFFQITNIKFEELQIKTFNGLIFKGGDACNLLVSSAGISLKESIERFIMSDENQNYLSSLSNKGFGNEPLSSSTFYFEEYFIHNWDNKLSVVTPLGESYIELCVVPISWKVEYREIDE